MLTNTNWWWQCIGKLSRIGVKELSRNIRQTKPIVIDWSMTFSLDTLWQGAPLEKCQWPVNETFRPTRCGRVHLYKTVIDRSMTLFSRHAVAGCTFTKLSLTGQWHFLNSLLNNVIDRSMTFFFRHSVAGCTFLNLSLIGQWQFSPDTLWQGAPLQNCHWQVNDSLIPNTLLSGAALRNVIDWSMTSYLWTSLCESLWTNVIDSSVNDICP